MLRSLLKDMGSYLPAKLVPALVALVSVPVITRLFPPTEYGHYTIVIATAQVFTNTLSWINVSIIRFYHQYRNRDQDALFYGTVLRLAILSVVLLGGVFWALTHFSQPFLDPHLYSLMRVGVLIFMGLCTYNILEHLLRARRLALWFSAFMVWQRLGAFVLGLALVLLAGFGIEGLLWGLVLAVGVALPFLFRVAVPVSPLASRGIDLTLARQMVRYGFPMVAGILAAWVLALSDRYILEFLAGSEAVGIYAANYNVAEKISLLVVNLFITAGTPLAMSVWENRGAEQSARFLNQLTRAFLVIALPALVGLSVVAFPLVTFFLDGAYHQGYLVIPFVAAGIFFLGLEQIMQAGLMFHQRTTLIMASAITACVFNIAANLLLVPLYGYMAAALTTLVSYLLYAVLVIIFARRYYTWPFPFATLGRVALGCALMGGAVYALPRYLALPAPLDLILAVATGMAVYFGVLRLLGEVNRAELSDIMKMARPKNPPDDLE